MLAVYNHIIFMVLDSKIEVKKGIVCFIIMTILKKNSF